MNTKRKIRNINTVMKVLSKIPIKSEAYTPKEKETKQKITGKGGLNKKKATQG